MSRRCTFLLRIARPSPLAYRHRIDRIDRVYCAGAALLALALADAVQATPSSTCADHLAEASSVSGLPGDIIASVLHVESRGNSGAVSSAGAMGCMQIMPATWANLTARYGLGNSAFDPRANMIGGALYLRQMIDRYGLPGAFAAYNAGPGRYKDWRDRGRRLPAETVNYVAQLAPTTRQPSAVQAPVLMPTPTPDWKQSLIFVALGKASSSSHIATRQSADVAPNGQSPEAAQRLLSGLQSPPSDPPKPRSDGLFAVLARP